MRKKNRRTLLKTSQPTARNKEGDKKGARPLLAPTNSVAASALSTGATKLDWDFSFMVNRRLHLYTT
jgi:hypothetical protein